MKPNEMIDGNWYYVHTMYPWYIKFKRFLPEEVTFCYAHICYRTKEYGIEGEYGTTPTNIRLIDISEIAEFLPKDHPDLALLNVKDSDLSYLIPFLKENNIV